ncbi:nicotinamidase-related amidase [Peribacillus simplex]|nr:nicotinamidase-related amidase [Peribacillus simplex]
MEENKALIIVDVQEAFEDKKWGERNIFLNFNAEKLGF